MAYSSVLNTYYLTSKLVNNSTVKVIKKNNFSLVSQIVVTTDGQRKEPKGDYLQSSAMSQIKTIRVFSMLKPKPG